MTARIDGNARRARRGTQRCASNPRPGRLDVDAVKSALISMGAGAAVLDYYRVPYLGTRTLRLAECPLCKRRQRRCATKVDRDTGRWLHHSGPGGAGDCKGDAFALVAALEGLDARSRFRDVLAIAAQIAGVTPDTDPAELERICAEYRARAAARELRATEERARGEAMVPRLWDRLARRHPRGEAYLASRGLDPEALHDRGGVVRFYRDGSPAVQLRSFDTGAPVNIARRLIEPLEDGTNKLTLSLGRLLGLGDNVVGSLSTCGSLVGSVAEVARNGTGIAVLTEGIADSIAAVLAFPGCTVVGANGWRRMAPIAAAVAPILARTDGLLLVAVHADEQGITGAADAMQAAAEAGLDLDSNIRPLDIGQHKDLADAYAAGQRNFWPIATSNQGGSP
jgi:hypothetical protein